MHWDWDKIKADYITNATLSQRDLAKKYDVPVSTLMKIAQKYHWYDEKMQYRSKVVSEIVDVAQKEEVNRTLRLLEVSDKILRALEVAAETLVVEDEEGKINIDAKSLKRLSSALKDIRDVQVREESTDQGECGVVLLPSVREADHE